MTKHRDSLNTADIRLLFDLPRPGTRHLRNPNTKPQKQNPRKGSPEAKQKSRKSFKASLRAAAADDSLSALLKGSLRAADKLDE